MNVKECMNNPFETVRPIDLHAAGVDPLFGTVACSGVFSYRIKDPVLFYKLLAGNVAGRYDRSKLNSQISAQLLKLLGPALNTLCIRGVRPSEIPAHTEEVSRAVREASAGGWLEEHGLELVSVAVSSLTPSDLAEVPKIQRLGPLLGGLGGGEKEASEPAKKKSGSWTCACGAENTGNFCRECGRPRKWTCTCGAENTGRFCTECGRKRP